jgi:hypothetical protein
MEWRRGVGSVRKDVSIRIARQLEKTSPDIQDSEARGTRVVRYRLPIRLAGRTRTLYLEITHHVDPESRAQPSVSIQYLLAEGRKSGEFSLYHSLHELLPGLEDEPTYLELQETVRKLVEKTAFTEEDVEKIRRLYRNYIKALGKMFLGN